jgi:hypothetical protein
MRGIKEGGRAPHVVGDASIEWSNKQSAKTKEREKAAEERSTCASDTSV